jgi:hypothetical protein
MAFGLIFVFIYQHEVNKDIGGAQPTTVCCPDRVEEFIAAEYLKTDASNRTLYPGISNQALDDKLIRDGYKPGSNKLKVWFNLYFYLHMITTSNKMFLILLAKARRGC